MDPSMSLLLCDHLPCYGHRHTAYTDGPRGQYAEANGPGNVDKSEALFSMYLERADADDQAETERWKNESDVLLVFVSSLINSLSIATPNVNAEQRRLVFTPRLSRPFLAFLLRTFNQVHSKLRQSTSQMFCIYSPTPIIVQLYPSPSENRPTHSILVSRRIQYGSTHFGP